MIKAPRREDVEPVIPTPKHYLINVYRDSMFFIAAVGAEVRCELFHFKFDLTYLFIDTPLDGDRVFAQGGRHLYRILRKLR